MDDWEYVRSGMKMSIYEGISATIFIVITQGVFLTGLALVFGADEFYIGVIGSIPLLSQIFQLITPSIVRRIGNRKQFTLINSLVSRLSWVIFIFFLMFNFKNIWAFLAVYIFSQITGAVAGNSWLSWMRDLVPEEKRGVYFGSRNFYISIASIAMTLIATKLLDMFEGSAGFEIVIMIGLVGAVVAAHFLNKQYEPSFTTSRAAVDFKAAFKDMNFKRLLYFSTFWNFIILFAAPFFPLYMVKYLKLSYSFMGILAITSSITAMVFYKVWGKISDVVGHKSIQEWAIYLVGINVIVIWLALNPSTVYLLWIDAIASGIGWSALNLTFMTLPFEVSGVNSRSYLAVYSTLNGLSGFAGGITGGITAKYLSTFSFDIGQFHIYGIQLFFLFTGVMRLLSIPLLHRVRVRRYIPVRKYIFSSVVLLSRRANLRARFAYPIGLLKKRHSKFRIYSKK